MVVERSVFVGLNCVKLFKLDKNEMGWACSAYGGGERRVQGFDGEIWGKETTGETEAQMGG